MGSSLTRKTSYMYLLYYSKHLIIQFLYLVFIFYKSSYKESINRLIPFTFSQEHFIFILLNSERVRLTPPRKYSIKIIMTQLAKTRPFQISLSHIFPSLECSRLAITTYIQINHGSIVSSPIILAITGCVCVFVYRAM